MTRMSEFICASAIAGARSEAPTPAITSARRNAEATIAFLVFVFPAALLADEVRSVVDAARPFVYRAVRIGADRPRARNDAAVDTGGDHLLGSDAVLDPLLERGDRVEGVRAARRAAAAVADVRKQEQPREVLDTRVVLAVVVLLEELVHRLVVRDGVGGLGQRVRPA